MLHTLEDFCTHLWPCADRETLRRRYFWLARLNKNSTRKTCYRALSLPRKDGGARQIMAPTLPLKRIQRAILPLLAHGAISPCAAAYRQGMCVRDNAAPHTGKPLVVKLDIQDFFGSIRFAPVFSAIDRALERSPLVGRHYLNGFDRCEPDPTYYNRVLSHYFTAFCTLDGSLVQGAPTSPLLSNLIFEPLDCLINSYCQKHSIHYTRYSDDMTFSGSFNPKALIGFTTHLLESNGFFLNKQKTAVLGKGSRQKITGVVVNEKLQADREYRRKIRQEVHYLQVYGVEDHLKHHNCDKNMESYLSELLGKISFVLQICPDDREFMEYRHLCQTMVKML